jgi:proteic killer suppression protein
MTVRSVRHKGLRLLLEHDSARALRPDLVARIRKILTALILASSMDDFTHGSPPGWRIHRLSGARRRDWSVSAFGNWRITFQEEDGEIDGLNLEDYQ